MRTAPTTNQTSPMASSYSLEQLIVGRLVLGFGVGEYNAFWTRQQARTLTPSFGIPTGIAAAITPLYSQSTLLSCERLRSC